jgi:hypothetical protein
MAKVYRTQKNMNKLSAAVVEDMDLDSLIQLAYEYQRVRYENMTRAEFEEAWRQQFD